MRLSRKVYSHSPRPHYWLNPTSLFPFQEPLTSTSDVNDGKKKLSYSYLYILSHLPVLYLLRILISTTVRNQESKEIYVQYYMTLEPTSAYRPISVFLTKDVKQSSCSPRAVSWAARGGIADSINKCHGSDDKLAGFTVSLLNTARARRWRR